MSWAPITGTKFQDASGNLLASGTICFQPSDGNGNPIPALASSGGFIVEASQATITNGVIASSFQVSPTGNFVYLVTITDCTSGLQVVLKGVTVTSAGINFDAFDPTLLLPTIPQVLVTLATSPTFTGPATAPIFNATAGLEVAGSALAFSNIAGTVSSSQLPTPTLITVAYSATPNFNFGLGLVQQITLAGNATPTFTNLPVGQEVTLIIRQDSTGGHAFNWPSIYRGGVSVDQLASTAAVFKLLFDGTNLYIVGTPIQEQ